MAITTRLSSVTLYAEAVATTPNHCVTDHRGCHDIDRRQFGPEGMELYGALRDFDDKRTHFEDLRACLDDANRTCNGIMH
jgi:hypothetical protein